MSTASTLRWPLRDIVSEDVMDSLEHLDLSKRLRFDTMNVVSGGAYGDVLIAACNDSQGGEKCVAAKRLRFYLKNDIQTLFEKEIYVWSKIRHHNVLPLLGFAFDPYTGFPLLISEWMMNGSVWEFANRNPRCDILHLVTGVAEGLSYLHENGIVHSDIKSDNILVSETGDPIICDFGCSRMIAASRTLGRLTTGIKGTTQYLAYELLAHPDVYKQHTKKTDVWAFGMTVYELITLKRPYEEVLSAQVPIMIARGELPAIPSSELLEDREKDDLWSLCQLCWNFDPEKRITMPETLVTINFVNFRKSIAAGYCSESNEKVAGNEEVLKSDPAYSSFLKLDSSISFEFKDKPVHIEEKNLMRNNGYEGCLNAGLKDPPSPTMPLLHHKEVTSPPPYSPPSWSPGSDRKDNSTRPHSVIESTPLKVKDVNITSLRHSSLIEAEFSELANFHSISHDLYLPRRRLPTPPIPSGPKPFPIFQAIAKSSYSSSSDNMGISFREGEILYIINKWGKWCEIMKEEHNTPAWIMSSYLTLTGEVHHSLRTETKTILEKAVILNSYTTADSIEVSVRKGCRKRDTEYGERVILNRVTILGSCPLNTFKRLRLDPRYRSCNRIGPQAFLLN